MSERVFEETIDLAWEAAVLANSLFSIIENKERLAMIVARHVELDKKATTAYWDKVDSYKREFEILTSMASHVMKMPNSPFEVKTEVKVS